MKKLLAIIFVVLVTIALYFSPVKTIILNVIYPHYVELVQKGYTLDEIKRFKADLSDDEYQLVYEHEYASDIFKIVTDAHYAVLKDKKYSEQEADEILSLEDAMIQFYLSHDNLSAYYNIIHHDYFVLDRFDRYVAYTNKYPDRDLTQRIRLVNVNRDYILYTHIQEVDLSLGTQLLVNKYYQLPQDYVPELKETYLGFMMQPEAADALTQMCLAMQEIGLDFSISNTYRSYDKQVSIYNRYLEKDIQNVVDGFSARPGHSEHQAGLAVDFKSTTEDIVYFENTDAYEWLIKNAHNYGFIQRYTEENSMYTGYQAEAWHFRYVGKDLALKVYESHLTLEEVLLLNR